MMANESNRNQKFEALATKGTGGSDSLPFLKTLRSSTSECLTHKPEETKQVDGDSLTHKPEETKQVDGDSLTHKPEETKQVDGDSANLFDLAADDFKHALSKCEKPFRPSTDESQNYDFVQMPCGFIYQLQLFSTWGYVYYVGLNGLEFYDANLQQIPLSENNNERTRVKLSCDNLLIYLDISAYPDSVNVLDNVQNDARTPDKLIDGTNDTADGAHTWLAPILPSILNRVYVIFDQPTTISMIKLWNYSKTANRGTKDFALLVDDLLVYNGVLQPVTTGARGILPTVAGAQPHHTILFTNNRDLIRKEKHNVISNQTGEQDVQMTNDKKIVSHYSDPKKAQSGKPVDQSKRPTTSVIHSKKRR